MTRIPRSTPHPYFGSRWRDILASEDDWAPECRSGATAFATTQLPPPTHDTEVQP